MQSWIHGLDPNSFEVSGKTPAAFNGGRTGAHLAPVSVPEESLLKLVWILLTNYFFIKKETHWNLSTSQELACFDKMSIRKLFLGWCFSAKTRNYQSHSALGVQQGTWTPGWKSLCGGTAMGDLKQHWHFPNKKPPAFWLYWVSFTLVLVNWKTFVTPALSPGAHLHHEGRGWCCRSVSSLMLGSSLGRGPGWIRRLSEAVQMMSSSLTETWQGYEPCIIAASYCKEGKPSEAPLCWI